MSVRRTAFWITLFTSLATLVIGLVGVAVSTSFDGALGRWLPWLVGVASSVAMAVIAAHVVGRSLFTRLTRLGEAAEGMARRPVTRIVPVHGGDPEVVRLYAAVETMSRSLHALLERERSFARYASHELRTPVGALKVQLERVELGSATAADVLPAVARQAARIEELIDALLALTRAREQGSRTKPLRPLIDETVEALEEADQPHVYVIEPVPEVAVREAVLVGQALRNLIDNAVRHGAGPVTVRVEQAGDLLSVRIRDMGAGIPGTVLRRLAEPTERREARSDGHGLGLTLVALIARALDGRLHLYNADVGVEASIDLRVIIEPSPERAEDHSSR